MTAQLPSEDEARAAFYGLIARLFYAPPDQGVLGQILNTRAFEESVAPIAVAWRAMVDACRTAFPVVLENEHTELFVGTGRAEVTPYLTHYATSYATENLLVELREHLRRWGIARRESASEPEDHIAGICEAMRFAIAMQHCPLDEQKAFFDRFLDKSAVAFCSAVNASAKAVFYRHVAGFTLRFLEVEREGFEMG